METSNRRAAEYWYGTRDSQGQVEEEQAQIAPGWYAHSTCFGLRTGPHKSKRLARESMRLAPDARARQRIDRGTDYPFPFDMLVWLEAKR